MSASIQIYKDAGVSSLCHDAWVREIKETADPKLYQIASFSPTYPMNNEKEVALVIIPGGYAPEMLTGLSSVAYQINKAIEQHASFLGSCAGAIAVSTSYSKNWFKNDKLHINSPINVAENSNLFLNQLPIRCPYYTSGGFFKPEPEHIASVKVNWLPSMGHYEAKICRLFHAVGPCFLMKDVPEAVRYQYRVLAYYETVGHVPFELLPAAAILQTPHLLNPRLFTGVHPEVGLCDLPLLGEDIDGEKVQILAQELLESEFVRKAMIRSWLRELKIATL